MRSEKWGLHRFESFHTHWRLEMGVGSLLGGPFPTARLPRMPGRIKAAIAWLAYGALLAVVFSVAGYFSFSFFVRSGVTTVPELVAKPEADVGGLLLDQGLRMRRSYDSDRYDEEIPAGHVLEQSPNFGSLVKRGAAVEVVMSLGPERLIVPDLQGKALQAAQVELTGSGLSLGRIVNVYSVGASPGTVVEQDPEATSHVGRGSAVGLFLSSASRADTYLMPDLVYRNFEVVRYFFERRGFRIGSIKFEPYEGIAAGTILRQYPLPGHPLARQDVVSLVVTTH